MVEGAPEKAAAGGASRPYLSLVIPIFCEEQVLPELLARTRAALDGLEQTSELLFVDDGSDDGSFELLRAAAQDDPRVRVVKLSRNFGLQQAVSAGLDHARGQVIALMDGDLQDPPELLGQMLQRLEEGHDVVYMIKRSRKEGLLRKAGFRLFYWLFQRLSRTPLPPTAGLFSVMRRRAVQAILDCPERNRFIPGLRTWVGYSQVGMEFDREARQAGEPSQTLGRLVRLAFDALYSFTDVPLKLALLLGLGTSLMSFLAVIIVSSLRIFTDLAISGWASTLVAIFFMGGVQLICVGLLGEYISRIYQEVRRRPRYIVESVLQAAPKEDHPGPGDP